MTLLGLFEAVTQVVRFVFVPILIFHLGYLLGHVKGFDVGCQHTRKDVTR